MENYDTMLEEEAPMNNRATDTDILMDIKTGDTLVDTMWELRIVATDEEWVSYYYLEDYKQVWDEAIMLDEWQEWKIREFIL